jgi:RNA polymerase sigma factor (sigma-70 family)
VTAQAYRFGRSFARWSLVQLPGIEFLYAGEVEIDDLVLAVLRGDSRAWKKLAVRLQADLRSMLRSSLDEADAEDIIQNTLMIVVRKLPEFEWRSGKAFRSWVRTIARHQVRELLRQRGRWDRQAGVARDMAAQRAPSATIHSRLDQARQGELVQEAITKLATPYRVVIENDLNEGQGDTLAEQEAIAPGTVKTRRRRARQMLRRHVRKRGHTVRDQTPKSPQKT